MDGNRRWAKARGLAATKGHLAGYATFKKIADHCLLRQIKILTVFAFSTENWQRPKVEVNFLIKLLEKGLQDNIADFNAKGVTLDFLGRLEGLPKKLASLMASAKEATKNNKAGLLNIAINYGGRDEIVRAVQKLATDKLRPEQINEQVFENALDTAGQTDPDLIIRTSGEQRLSGFLPWQAVYAELSFFKQHWPDFTENDLDAALLDFAKRKRRFGGS